MEIYDSEEGQLLQEAALALYALVARSRLTLSKACTTNNGKHGTRIPQTVLRNPSHPLAVDARLGAAKQTEI